MPVDTYARSDVTIVSVLFNSSETIQQQLASLPKDVPCIWVDNGSRDIAATRQLARSIGCTLIENKKNRGFGAACNQACEMVETEFVLFLNPDAALSPDALETLVKAARDNPKASAFNPILVTDTGRRLLKRSSVLVSRAQWPGKRLPHAPKEVSVLSGAAMLVRTEAFGRVSGFDEKIFLFHEDDDLSLRIKTAFGPLLVIPQAEVTHSGGRSSPRSPEMATLRAWHMGRSRIYTTLKHKRPHGRIKALTSALVQIASPLLLFSRRKRAKQSAFLRGILSSHPN